MPWPSKSRGDRKVRAGVGAPFDRDVDGGPDGSVHAADAPLVRRIEADELRGDRSVGEADAPRRETAVPDLGGAALSIRPLTTPFCHSEKRPGSVA